MSINIGTAVGLLELDAGNYFKTIRSAGEEFKTFATGTTIQSAALKKQIENLGSEVVKIESAIRTKSASLVDYRNKIESSKQKVDEMTLSHANSRNVLTEIQTSYNIQKRVVEENGAKVKELQAEYKTLSESLGKNSEEAKKSKDAYNVAKQSLSEQKKELSELKVKLKESTDEEKKHSTSLKEAKAEVKGATDEYKNQSAELTQLRSRLESTNEALAHHESRYEELNGTMQSINTRFSALSGGLASVGGALTKNVTMPIIGAGSAIGIVSGKFEVAMSEVKAISGATGQQFDLLKEKAKDLGASTRFSATEAANGMTNLASAGFNTSEIISAMPGLLDMAVAGNVDLAQASDIAASTLRGFGLAASETGHVADVLAKIGADTNAGITDTGEAMKYVAPIASSMGISLEEVTAAIGMMANAGIKGGQAGTTLRSALTSLASPTDEAGELMKQLGIVSYDANGKMLPLKEVIGNIKNAMGGLTEQSQQQAISTIFGQQAMSGMLTIIKEGPEVLGELTQSLENCDGASKEMAETMGDNVQGRITALKSKMEGVGIQLGETLLPMIEKGVKTVSALVDSFANLDPKTQEMIVSTGAMVAAVGPMLIIGGKIAGGISAISGLLVPATAGVTGLGVAGAGAGVGLGAMLVPLLPIIGAVAAVGIAIGGAAMLWNNHQKAQEEARQEMINVGSTLADLREKIDTVSTSKGNMQALIGEWQSLDAQLKTTSTNSERYKEIQEKLESVQEKIISGSGGLISKYDIENDKFKEKIPLLEKQIELEERLAVAKLKSTLAETDIKALEDEEQKLKDSHEELIETQTKQQDLLLKLRELQTDYMQISKDASLSDEQRKEKISALNDKFHQLGGGISKTNGGVPILGASFNNLFEVLDGNTAFDIIEAHIAETGESVNKTKGELDATTSSIEIYKLTAESIAELEVKNKTAIEQKNIALGKMKQALDDGSISQSEYDDGVEKLNNQFARSDLIEKRRAAISGLNDDFENGNISQSEYTSGVEDANTSFDENIKKLDENSESLENNTQKQNSLSQEVKDYVGNAYNQGAALEEVIKNEKLSSEQIQEMISLYPELSGYVETHGLLALSTGEDISSLSQTEKDNMLAIMKMRETKLKGEVEDAKTALEAARERYAGEAKIAANFYGAFGAMTLNAMSTEEEKAKSAAYEKLSKDLVALQGDIKKVEGVTIKAGNASSSAGKKSESAINSILKTMEHKKKIGEISAQEEITQLEDILNSHKLSNDERMSITEKLYNAKQNLGKDTNAKLKEAMEEQQKNEEKVLSQQADVLKNIGTRKYAYEGGFYSMKMNLIDTAYIKEVSSIDSVLAMELSAGNEKIQKQISIIEMTDKETAAKLQSIQNQTKALENANRIENENIQKKRDKETLDNLKKAQNEAKTSEEIARTKKAYDDEYERQQNDAKQKKRNSQIATLNEEAKEVEKSAKKKIDTAVQVIESERELQDDSIKNSQKALDEYSKDLKETYTNIIEEGGELATSMVENGINAQKAAVAVLELFYPEWELRGKKLAEYFKNGVNEGMSDEEIVIAGVDDAKIQEQIDKFKRNKPEIIAINKEVSDEDVKSFTEADNSKDLIAKKTLSNTKINNETVKIDSANLYGVDYVNYSNNETLKNNLLKAKSTDRSKTVVESAYLTFEKIKEQEPLWRELGDRLGSALQVGMKPYLDMLESSIKSISGRITSAGSNTPIGTVSGYATGTDNVSEGWHWVGENGPELMRFSGGEKVMDSVRSLQIANEFRGNTGRRNEGGYSIEDVVGIVKSSLKALQPSNNIEATFINSKSASQERKEMEFLLSRMGRGVGRNR